MYKLKKKYTTCHKKTKLFKKKITKKNVNYLN